VRVACADDEIARGCEPNGPDRAWFLSGETTRSAPPSIDELIRAVSEPLASWTIADSP